MKKLKVRCYCCGDRIKGAFALVSQSTREVDRAFIMKPEHTDRVSEGAILFAMGVTVKEATCKKS